MFEQVTVNLMSEDLDETIAFYENRLDFTMLDIVEADGKKVWTLLQKDQIQLMFQEKHSLVNEYPSLGEKGLVPSMSLFIKVKDIVSLYAELSKQTDVNIIKSLETSFYGMSEFAILDPNGYVLTFAQRKESTFRND